MSGKRYDKEFKMYAVKMVTEDGRKVAEVARELDIVHQTLHKWVAKYEEEQEDAFVGSGNLPAKDKVEYEKDKRIRDLEEENAILKKAMGIFAKSRK
nr:transposase [Lentibacillus jeotgali]